MREVLSATRYLMDVAADLQTLAGVVREDVVQSSRRLGEFCLQVVGMADRYYSTMDHDGYTVAKAVGLFHEVCRQENRHAEIPNQEAYLLPHQLPRNGVQPDGGLVQKYDGRAMNEGHGDLQAPHHPARIRTRETVGRLVQPHNPESLMDARLNLASVYAMKPGKKAKILPPSQGAIRRDQLRDVGNSCTHLCCSRSDIEPGHLSRSRGWWQQGCQGLHEGALACTVRAKQPKDFSRSNGKGHPVYGGQIAKATGESLDGNDICASGPLFNRRLDTCNG